MKNNFILLSSIFFANTLIMIFEIIGSRMLGPFVGTSILVWSSIIGIILFFLSLGSYYGGILADKNPDIRHINTIFFSSGIVILFIFLYKDLFLESFYHYTTHIGLYTIFVSVILFAPTSYLLGMIGPISMKLAIDTLDTTGKVVGWMSGVGASGAILGTLGAGFFLIPNFGLSSIIWSVGLLSVLLPLLYAGIYYKKLRDKNIVIYLGGCVIYLIVFMYFF